jgi:hypothetical protein
MRQAGGWMLFGAVALSVAVVAAAPATRPVRSDARVAVRVDPSTRPVRVPTTQHGQWIDVGRGVRARAFLGFWGADARPGHAAKVVRLIPQGQSREHFGVTLSLQVPPRFTGKLHYEERLKFERPPRIWEGDGGAGRHVEHGATRFTSNDGRTTTITQVFEYIGGRLQAEDGGPAGDGTRVPFYTWDFSEGDPLGTWQVEAWVNQKCVGRFAVEVVWGRPEDEGPVVEGDEALDGYRPGGG